MLAGRSAQIARNACIFGGLLYLVVGLLPVYFGLIGPALVPGLADGEQVVPKLAALYLPKLLYIVFVGAMISAILSTVDSALLAAGAILSRNTIQRVTPQLNDQLRLLVTRATVALLGGVATLIALQSESIHDMIEVASALGSAGLVVVLCFGLFTSIGGPPSAIAALITGTAVWLAGTHIFVLSTPYLAGVCGATAAYLIFSMAGDARLGRYGA